MLRFINTFFLYQILIESFIDFVKYKSKKFLILFLASHISLIKTLMLAVPTRASFGERKA